ncbi:MAG: EAL domain-containing protein [Pseudomonadales bacterium]|nr:EAL domain-containing protein [Pseudomonadales bacterium]
MGLRILIVDDTKDNVALLKAVLEEFPTELDVAYNGEEALKKVDEFDYALILMDVNMPVMGGFECVDKIRAQPHYRHIPIIFITAIGDRREFIDRGYQSGAVDYISKPVDADALCSKVNIFLELKRKQLETDVALSQVRALQRNYEQILNYTAEGILGLDTENFIHFANAAACTLLTVPKDKLIGTNIKDYVDPHSKEKEWLESDFVQIFRDGQCNQSDDSFFWRQKTYQFPVQYTQSSILDGEDIQGGVIVFQDVSERKEIENELINLAKFDQLTGLANRTLYWEFLEKSIEVAKRQAHGIYIIFIDLDHFKEINDTLGHDAGDLLLVQASERLRSTLRSADLISRLGGDEFAVIIQHAESDESVAGVCQKLIATFEQPFQIFGKEAYIGCSLGVARFPGDGTDASSITKAADTAMYSAKHGGRNNYQFFHGEMHTRVQAHMEVANELRTALKTKQIIPYYQVKVDFQSQQYIGAEALARWVHTDKGIIAPDVFIPVAEDTGLIANIGETMIQQASEDFLRLQSEIDLPSPFRVSINISAKQVQDQNFAGRILQLLEQQGISPESVELELTETSIINAFVKIRKELMILKQAGVHISIDDFGTGYSSLAYLKQLPIDTLKIDKVFVRDIGQEGDDESIVRAIISLGHSLGMKVLAEGVETHQQIEFLLSEGCDQAQGFFFGRPVGFADFKYLLGGEQIKNQTSS